MLRTKMSPWFSYWRVKKQFPALPGPFAVGCTDYMCSDDSASSSADCESPQTGDLLIRYFYPTEKTATTQDEGNHCLWIPRPEYTTGMLNFMAFPTWLLGRLFFWIVGNLRIPAVLNAPVFKPQSSNSEGQLLPCVVFSHGLGGNRLINSAFCCDLASRGCLVTCIEHRDKSASATFVLNKNDSDNMRTEEWIPYRRLQPSDDEFKLRNSQVHERADECVRAHNLLKKIHMGNFPPNLLNDTSVLQQLKGRLNLNKVAVMGHSFGGATTVMSLAKDKRFRCGVALDVWMLPLGEEIYNFDIDQPLLFVNTHAFHKWTENIEPQKKFINKKPDTRPIIAIRWTHHMDQCDIPAVLPPFVLRYTKLRGRLNPTIALSLNCQAIWAHLSRHLDIGNPPQHLPIIDGGEDTPKLVIIGQDYIPPSGNLEEMMADYDSSHDAQNSSCKQENEATQSTKSDAEVQNCS
ncbi:platelet-activating factor acetylhydrolase 2, cytoplasmic-like [Montipora capricornis]|uniref:platelet-activating factor acetylhydrolase 2, cytoplasmic-like n=1 Tax=Montipora capricornis TaxID=246305 RepID=UPI0035F12E54